MLTAADTLLVSALGPDRRAALLAGDRLRHFACTPPDAGLATGDVCLGRVVAVDRRLAACFVDVGEARPGFLMFADLAAPEHPPAEGERLLCRVLRGAVAGKGAKLAGRPPFAAPLVARAGTLQPPALVRAAPRAVDRLIAGLDPERVAAVLVDDGPLLATLKTGRPAIASRLRLHTDAEPLFTACGIDAEIDAALADTLLLPAGGRLALCETPAAVTIDVDLAAAGAGDDSSGAAAATTNLEAMAEIAWQIGLRDLAGHIVIDPLASRDPRLRGRMLATLSEGLAAAEAAAGGSAARVVRIGGFTRLGLIELTRERRGPSLSAALTVPCPDCATGRVLAPWFVAGDALRRVIAEARMMPGPPPRLAAAPAVAAALAGAMADARRAAEARLGAAIPVIADAAVGRAGYRILPGHGR